MAKQVIVNADDFGLSHGANKAIFALLESGNINSTTVMANGPAFAEAAELHAQNNRAWNVGLHFNLTQFGAVSSAAADSSLTDDEGKFLGRRHLFGLWFKRDLDGNNIKTELRAQLEHARASGFDITHIDSHQHAHCIPAVCRPVCEVAHSENLPVRWVYPDRLIKAPSFQRAAQSWLLRLLARRSLAGVEPDCLRNDSLVSIFAAGGQPSVARYRQLIDTSRSNCIELMVHPACREDGHRKLTSISDISERDWQVLQSPEWSAFMKSGEYDFVTYSEAVPQ